MAPETMTEAGFVPIHAGHSIEHVLIGIRFGPEASDSCLARIHKALGPLESLPKRSKLRGLTVAVGSPGAMSPQFSESDIVLGTAYSRHNAEGNPEAELRIEKSAISYRTNKYVGWRNIWEFLLENVLSKALPEFARESNPTACLIAYTDKFVCKQADTSSSVHDVLRRNSRYLCPYIFDTNDFWHSHTGAFEHPHPQCKRLLNINADYREEQLEEGSRRALLIGTSLTDFFPQRETALVGQDSASMLTFLEDKCQRLHEASKQALSQVLSDSACQRIALLD